MGDIGRGRRRRAVGDLVVRLMAIAKVMIDHFKVQGATPETTVAA